MRTVSPGESVTLFLQLDNADSLQYPTAIILSSAGAIAGTVNMNQNGSIPDKYTGAFTFLNVGDYNIKYIVYQDAARTIMNPKYRFSDETIQVSNMEKNIEDIVSGNLGSPVAIFD